MAETIRHGLFIEPEGDVLDLVTAWKRRVAVRWPDARYLSHPPHATVWVGALGEPDAAARAVADAVRDTRRDRIQLSGPHVFYDDRMADDGQTLTFAAPLTESLSRLQRAVCDTLAPHMTQSYPFAGAHWIPHFTVASLPVLRDDAVITEFLSTPAVGVATSWGLGWWRVAGDRHDRLCSL